MQPGESQTLVRLAFVAVCVGRGLLQGYELYETFKRDRDKRGNAQRRALQTIWCISATNLLDEP